MPLAIGALPLTTPLDPIEEPPGSIDPLGTLAHAERLAELLLPGLTARMWRARLLTVAALAAAAAGERKGLAPPSAAGRASRLPARPSARSGGVG